MLYFLNLTPRTLLLIAVLIAFLWAARGYPKWRKNRLAVKVTPEKPADASENSDTTNNLSSLLNLKSIPVLPLAAVYIILRAAWDLFCLTVYYSLLACEKLGVRLDSALFHFVTVRLPVMIENIGHWWTTTGIHICRKAWQYTTTNIIPRTIKGIDQLAWRLSVTWTALGEWISAISIHLQQAFITTKQIAVATFHAIEAPIVWIAWRISRLASLISNGAIRISKALWQDIRAVSQVVSKILLSFWNSIGYPVTVFIVDKAEIMYRALSTVGIKMWNIVATRLVLPLYRLIRPPVAWIYVKIFNFLLSEEVQKALKTYWKKTVSMVSYAARDVGVLIQSIFKAINWLIMNMVIPFYRTLRYQLLPNLSALYIRLQTAFWNILSPILSLLSPLLAPVIRACSMLYDKFLYPAICQAYSGMINLGIKIINRIRFQHNLYRLCQALYSHASTAAMFLYEHCAAAYQVCSEFFWQHAPAISNVLAKLSDQIIKAAVVAWAEAQTIGSQISSSVSVQAEAVAQSLERVVGTWIDAQTDESIGASKLKTQ
ncbi:hypothetical protein K450DRAFT_218227 [Umbelopsis ramanniana AG]|uniref:Uncharacterized protein n=1 Tax=Umbelopsis ramanniana AG TaxID=1314678 RepID=A0AAD5HIW8_UMBRA|nr:uncharacterized protein K450DRAFT_218227 [Umbelopsis ramanniana AG]KAI8584116.1 hypothetical protein K450DRAFT_218227 [Umbelopsis ramanniana AG]